MDTRTGTLDVPGATLYYEVRGAGPLLLMIPGGNGDLAPFAPVAGALADRYTVAAFERRGFSRSPLARPPDPDGARVADDADDAARMVAHLGGGDPAYVFGSSSGALVALEVMVRHPDAVRLLVPHEPPAVTLLPDGRELAGMLDGVYATYRSSGVRAAMAEFGAAVFGEQDGGGGGPLGGDGPPPPAVREMAERIQANLPFWMEHELRSYPSRPVGVDALRPHAARVAPVCGRDSRAQFPYRATEALAALLDRPVTELPGGHVGYITHADAFAPELAAVLATA